MKKLILNSLFSLFIILCFSCSQSTSGNNNGSEQKGDDSGNHGSTPEVISDNDNQSLISITYPTFNAGDTYRINSDTPVYLAFSAASTGELFILKNGQKTNQFSFTYSNGVLTSQIANDSYKGYIFKDSSGNIYESDLYATRTSGSGFFSEWDNGITSFRPREDGTFTWVNSENSGTGTWRNNNGKITFFYEGDEPLIFYFTSDNRLYYMPYTLTKCDSSKLEPIEETDSSTDDDNSDSESETETETVKTEAECKHEIAIVKQLIDIPTVAITTDSFTYCDLPTGIQGYKDVVIDWSSNSDYCTVDNSLGIISEVYTAQFIKLTANITCGEYSDSKTFTVKVYPKNSTSITEADYFEAAIFSYSLNQKINSNKNNYWIWTSFPQYFNYGTLTNIKVTLSSDNKSVSLKNNTLEIYKSPVRKIVKIAVTFNASVNRVSTTKTRIYYLDISSDFTEYNAAVDNKLYGTYRFEDNILELTSNKTTEITKYKYDISENDDFITLSVFKKYTNGKWYTKKEWLKEFGNTATLKRQAEYMFFTNKIFAYKVASKQASINNKLESVTSLLLTPQWDSSQNWTLQYGKLVEKANDYSAFSLPVHYNEFNKWHNSTESKFEPLLKKTGTFNSDYTNFTALNRTWNVTTYELLDKHYVDFTSGTETHSFYYEPYDLAKAEW